MPLRDDEPTAPGGISAEVLDLMVEAELAYRYKGYARATELLNRVVRKCPWYLPAKELLQEVFEKSGELQRASEIAHESDAIRQQLISQSNDGSTATEERLQRRQFISRIDALVKELYDLQSDTEILKRAATKLLENLHGDRCMIIIQGKDGWKPVNYEACTPGVKPSLTTGTAKLNYWIAKTLSASSDPLVLAKAMEEPLLAEHGPTLAEFSIQAVLACPLVYRSTVAGLIVIHRCEEPGGWSEQETLLLSTVSGHIAVAVKSAQQHQIVESQKPTLPGAAQSDPRLFEERLSVELRNAHQQQYPLCLAVLYVDQFEKLKAACGANGIESLLHKVEFLVKTHLRKGSVVTRTREEEFAILLPNMAESQAQQLMDNISGLVQKSVKTGSGNSVTVRVRVKRASLDLLLSGSQSNKAAAPVSADSGDKPISTFKGDLSEIGITDIIQIIENSHKSGKLFIQAEETTGIVFFNSGRIVDAAYKDTQGKDAFFSLLAVSEGRFEYEPSTVTFDEKITSSNTFLVLEGLRLMDEANRDLAGPEGLLHNTEPLSQDAEHSSQ